MLTCQIFLGFLLKVYLKITLVLQGTNNVRVKMRGEGDKNVHEGGGVKNNTQNFVHVEHKCPLRGHP